MLSCFPASAEPGKGFTSVTYSQVAFREPESRADQTRLMGIVTTGLETGYYVDVFRSRKERGGDKMHDYFYHNLGQTMTLTAADGISMNLWMKGEPEREVFTALAPMTEGLSRTPHMPYNIKEQPTLTFVARQHGEAWNRPFVAVYEPSTRKEPSAIQSVSYFDAEEPGLKDFAGICVESKNGRTDHIFSLTDSSQTATYQGMKVKADYAVISNEYAGNRTLFMGNGTQLIASGISIQTSEAANVLLEKKQGKWYILSSAPCKIVIDGKAMQSGITTELTLLAVQ